MVSMQYLTESGILLVFVTKMMDGTCGSKSMINLYKILIKTSLEAVSKTICGSQFNSDQAVFTLDKTPPVWNDTMDIKDLINLHLLHC